jgi:hypothetical protein
MSKAKQPEAARVPTQRAEFDQAEELLMLAIRIDDLVTATGTAALESALALAGSPTAADVERARKLADELSERSSRLEQDIGRTLLSARIT